MKVYPILKNFFTGSKNSKTISVFKDKYGMQYLKSESSKVFMPLEMDTYVHNVVADELPWIEKYAELSGKPIKFYPKGKLTLMNYGPRTTVIDNKSSKETIVEQIKAHMNKVL